MENIEEHCEDNMADNDTAFLIKNMSSRTSAPPSASSSSTATTSLETNSSGSQLRSSLGSINSTSSSDTTQLTSGSYITASTSGISTAPSAAKRMPHLHKLEKKHSSGDLHSRLKTRKLLGVGETDDGDIHRSKLSQILGHSDQLYIRLPYGLRLWQLFTAIMFTVTGLWALVLPSHLFSSSSQENVEDYASLPGRLYGGAIISLSIVYWMTLSSQDRDIIRMCLLTSMIYFVIQFVVSVFTSTTLDSPLHTWLGTYVLLSFRAGQIFGSLYFYVVLTRDSKHYR